MAKDYLLLLADREPLTWVLTAEQMAFPAGRARLAGQLAKQDRLFLYTTRGCFHNPTKDRGRIIGEATVTSTARTLDEPVVFGDHVFPLGCAINITGLVARDYGPELATLVARMHLFPDSNTWSARLRRVLAPLDEHDAALLHEELSTLLGDPATHRDSYLYHKPA